ncbi:hypothetical protein LINGRAHAP2_LOCUS13170 [Linum grandiflorum]
MDYPELLNDDILEKILLHHLPSFFDRIRFSEVCKSWNSLAFRGRRRQRLPGILSRRWGDVAGVYQFFPISMMRFYRKYYYDDDYDYDEDFHYDYNEDFDFGYDYDYYEDYKCGYVCPCRDETGTKSVTSDRYAGKRPIDTLPRVTLPIVQPPRSLYRKREIEEKHLLACLDGWLLIADPRPTRRRRCLQLHLQLQLHLLNPITRATIALPRRPHLLTKLLSSRDDIVKAVLSSSPDNVHVDCHVIVLLKSSPYLAWCKVLGEGRGWKLLTNEIFETEPIDVSYYGETLYVVDFENVYVVRDLVVTSSRRKPSVGTVSLSPLPTKQLLDFELATDLAGQLLIIWNLGKLVYKLVASNSNSSGNYKWEKVTSLDGYAVFIGKHQSFSLPVSDDDNNGIIANRIYSPRGMLNLECGCFTEFSSPSGEFWFLPMPR